MNFQSSKVLKKSYLVPDGQDFLQLLIIVKDNYVGPRVVSHVLAGCRRVRLG